MKLGLHVGVPGKKRAGKALAAAAEEAAGFWRAGKKEEAVAILNDIFDAGVPSAEQLAPYAKEFGAEYRDLVSKLYLLRFDPEDEEWEWNLAEFEETCGGGLVTGFASRLAGAKWEEVREKFYEKCPGCMFMGDTAEPYSLKLRSENCIECIPEDDCDLHELARPADDYGHAMDGYSFFEGYALVRDDPGAKKKYPPEIKAVLEKVKARKLKYFPNVIFPLVEGKDLFDSCSQMLELLQLLDHGYRFESVSRYITAHPELFPEVVKKRLEMLKSPGDDDDPEFEEELEEEEIVPGPEAEETPAVPAPPKTPAAVEPPPELDLKRIAEDEARGIRFSADKRVFEKYPEKLRTASYEIPRGVIAIKESAFRECKNLKSVTIPEGVMFIGEGAFSRCGKLANVTIPKSVLRIGCNAFWSCESLTEAVIPEGITEIGESTFWGCSALKRVVIPSSVRKIGDSVFNDCFNLTGAAIPEGVEEIRDHTFCECSKLAKVKIPQSVRRIGEWAFHECERLTEVVIPEGVTAIEENTFCGCSRLKKAVIPASVTKIGKDAFSRCENLTEVVIPAGVTEIGESAFFYCEKLTQIVIPAGVTEIAEKAFIGCKSLARAVIPEGVTSIGNLAFGGCENLSSVVIPESVLVIGDKAFKKCAKLTEVVIPAGVRIIGEEAFAECPCEPELKKKYPHLFP